MDSSVALVRKSAKESAANDADLRTATLAYSNVVEDKETAAESALGSLIC